MCVYACVCVRTFHVCECVRVMLGDGCGFVCVRLVGVSLSVRVLGQFMRVCVRSVGGV